MAKRAFTLVEMMVAISIFAVVMGFVLSTLVTTFRTTRVAQETSQKQQAIRFVFFKMNKEINSIIKLMPKNSSGGSKGEFFFAYAKPDSISEAGYVYNTQSKALEYFSQEHTDYNPDTYDTKKVIIKDVEAWEFAYSDGVSWYDLWQDTSVLPKAVKLNFKLSGERDAREMTVNVPAGS